MCLLGIVRIGRLVEPRIAFRDVSEGNWTDDDIGVGEHMLTGGKDDYLFARGSD